MSRSVVLLALSGAMLVGGSVGIAADIAGPAADKVAFVSIRSGDAHIYVANAKGVERVVTKGKSVNTQPAWSPDGRLAFTSSRNGIPRIYLINEDGSGERRLTQDDRIESAASWSPDGKAVAFYSSGIESGQVDLRIVDVASGKSITVIGNGKDKGPVQPAWSGDGRRLAFIGNDEEGKSQVWVVNRDGSDLREVSSKFSSRSKAWASLSPDGKQVAYIADMRGAFHLIVTDLESGQSKNLTDDIMASHESPRWSPDGKQIAFASTRDDELRSHSDIFTMNADGTAVRNLTRNSGENFAPQWVKDGKHILFTSLRSGTSQLFEVDMATGKTLRVTKSSSHDMEHALPPLDFSISKMRTQ